MIRALLRPSWTLLIATAAVPVSAQPAARGPDASLEVCAKPIADEALAEAQSARLNQEVGALAAAGRFRQAAIAARRALAITAAVHGQSSQQYAADLHTLANLYVRQGDFFNAESMLLRALEVDKKRFGAKHAEVGMDLCGLGNFYTSRAQAAELRQGAEASQSMYRSALGQQDAGLVLLAGDLQSSHGAERHARCLRAKGTTLLALNRYEAAVLALNEAAKQLEPEHPTEAVRIHLRISQAAVERGDHREAMAALARVEELRERLGVADAEDSDAGE